MTDLSAFDPPEWATGAFLDVINTGAKMAARQQGEAGAVPHSWTTVDAVLAWWETEGRARWLAEQQGTT